MGMVELLRMLAALNCSKVGHSLSLQAALQFLDTDQRSRPTSALPIIHVVGPRPQPSIYPRLSKRGKSFSDYSTVVRGPGRPLHIGVGASLFTEVARWLRR
jgi:hypothetical protein